MGTEKETGVSVGSSAPRPSDTSLSSTPSLQFPIDVDELKEPQETYQPFYKRHRIATGFGCCLIVVVLVVVIVVIVVLTVFKVKDPTIKINNATLQNITFSLSLPTLTPTLNLALRLNVSVHNPNQASFRYTNSTDFLYYHGLDVGNAAIPAGSIGADASEEIILIVTVKAANFLGSSNFTSDVAADQIPLQSLTTVSGRVKAFSIYKHHASSTASCGMVIIIRNATLSKFHCSYQVKV